MDVIWHAANLDGLHLILSSNSTQEWPKSFHQHGCNYGTALLRAENAMKMGADVGHTMIQPSPRDLCNPKLPVPTLKRWAIITCPSGTDFRHSTSSFKNLVLKGGRVGLLGIELHQRGRVPVAHSASLRAKVVEYLLCRRRMLPGGGALPQSPELRQPCLSVRRRCGPRYGGESGHRLPLAGDDHFFTLLNQVDQP